MAKSTNKSIADREAAKAHHVRPQDVENAPNVEGHELQGSRDIVTRNETEEEREERKRRHEPDERGRRIEREVAKKAKK